MCVCGCIKAFIRHSIRTDVHTIDVGVTLDSFEGVCITTVILAPGACRGGLRAAVLDTTSVAKVAKVAKVLCSRRLDFIGRHRKR